MKKNNLKKLLATFDELQDLLSPTDHLNGLSEEEKARYISDSVENHKPLPTHYDLGGVKPNFSDVLKKTFGIVEVFEKSSVENEAADFFDELKNMLGWPLMAFLTNYEKLESKEIIELVNYLEEIRGEILEFYDKSDQNIQEFPRN